MFFPYMTLTTRKDKMHSTDDASSKRGSIIREHAGTLELTLICGTNLKAADRNGFSDPFVVVSVETLYTLHNDTLEERQVCAHYSLHL
jgi:hypothetical protein